MCAERNHGLYLIRALLLFILRYTHTHMQQENPFASDRQRQQQQQAREKLPQDRSYSFEDPLSPSHSADGYLTVQGVMEVFQRRAREGDGWSSHDVATDFKISHTDTENLLKYFSAYRVRDSQQKLEKPLQFHLLHE